MIAFLKNNIKLFKKSFKNILLFEIVYKLIFIILLLPISTLLTKLSIKVAGYKYLTNENFFAFLRSPVTIISFLIIIFLILVYLTFEFYCVYTILQLSRINQKMDIDDFIKTNIDLIINTLNLKNFGFLFLSLIYGIITNVMIWFSISSITKIPDEITRYLNKNPVIYISIFIFVGVIYLVGVLLIFSINYFAINGLTFKESIKNAVSLIKNKYIKILSLYIVWNIAILIFMILVYVIVIILLILGIRLLVQNSGIHMAVFLEIFNILNYIIIILGSVVSISANFCFITNLYNRFVFNNFNSEFTKTAKLKKNDDRIMMIITLSTLGILSTIASYLMLNDANVKQWIGIKTPFITSHRGSSYYAPENTMLAIEYAVRDLSDYVEIDVQETKDGEIIIIHDLSLKRTTGVNKKVHEVTYDEIKNLDAGKWFDKNLQDATIPTLDEVLDYCKGKIKLNIEIKGYKYAKHLEEKVVEKIKEHNMEKDCFVSSFNYESLKKVKELSNEIKTGYIVSSGYGDFSKMKYVDFFSIRATAVNRKMINEIHASDKDVHVWTINSANQMKTLTQLGVDNIITDNPVLANEVIHGKNTSTTFLEMLDIIFE